MICTNLHIFAHPLQSSRLRSKPVKNPVKSDPKRGHFGPVWGSKGGQFLSSRRFSDPKSHFLFLHVSKSGHFYAKSHFPVKYGTLWKTPKSTLQNRSKMTQQISGFWLSGVKMGYFLNLPRRTPVLRVGNETYRRVRKRSFFDRSDFGV